MIGTWIIPTFITIVAIYIACSKMETQTAWYDMSPIVNLIYLGGAIIISLLAWLVWSLFT